MATYTNLDVGYGQQFDINMWNYEDINYDFCWNGTSYILGYVLYLERADKVNGLTVDKDWENVKGTDGTPVYYEATDDEGDTQLLGSVIFAKDGAQVNNIHMYRGAFLINEPGDNNPDDTRWTTTVNGLILDGEFAIARAYADTSLSNVVVNNGALYSSSEDLCDITVSNLGKVRLFNGSSTLSLTMTGGFVQADAGSYIRNATVKGGELYLATNSIVDAVTVSNGGILLTDGAVSVRDGVIGKNGIFVVSSADNSLMDFEYEEGAKVSIGSGVYSTTRPGTQLRFSKGVTVGYGFNNANLSYFIDGVFYSTNANESRNFIAAGELVNMSAGQNAYNMTIEDGGALVTTGGNIDGLTIHMNYAELGGKTVANSIVLEAPELIDSNSALWVIENASATNIRAYDDCIVYMMDKAKATRITLNDHAELYFWSDSAAEGGIITLNDTSYMDVQGSSVAKNITLNSGVVEVSGSGRIENVNMNGGALHSWDGANRVTNVTQYGGTIAVQGTLDGITVHSGARLVQVGDADSSGAISNMTLKEGAWIAINNISTINGSFDPSKVTVGYDFNSGYQENGKESYKYIVSFYGSYYINNGWTAKDMCVSVGNTLVQLCNGGTMVNGDIENGCLTVQGAAKMQGTINLYGETYYMDDANGFYEAAGINFLSDDAFIENATFNFVLGNNKQLEDYTVNTDLTNLGLSFAENYGDGEDMFDISLTIDADLKKGETYSMYLGSGFKMEGVDIYDKNGNYLGTVTSANDSSNPLVVNGRNISLVSLNTTNKIYERQWAIYVEATVAGKTDSDIDGNGLVDVIMNISRTSHPNYGSTGSWLIQEKQTAKWGNLSTLKAGGEVLGVGTLDSSKDTGDIFVYDAAGRTVGAWVTNDSGKVSGWKTVYTLNSATNVIGLGDFNADGETDLLLRNNNGAIGCVFTDGPVTGWNYFQSVGKEWEVVAVGDFNGDGRSDLVLKHDAGFAGCWLTNASGTVAWSSLDQIGAGYEIVGAGDFNGDGVDDVLLQKDNYFGAWIVENGNAKEWMGLGKANGTVEQVADFNSDGIDDIRLRTDNGAIGALIVNGEDSMTWKYYGSVGKEWNTALAALQ